MIFGIIDWRLIDFGLIDVGLILYILSFIPSEECSKCGSNICYGDDSYLTIPKKINGEIKNLIYCSSGCTENI